MGNATLLTLLKAGCRLEMPSGYAFKGDPETGYIDLITPFGPDGLVLLNRDGVDEAFRYEKMFRQETERAAW